MQAMILAAGLGTRLRPYTLLRPKPLLPVCNVPLLHVLLDKLAGIGCSRIVVNCHYLADQIADAVADRPEVMLQRETEILGTGGGLRKALDKLADEPLLVLNGDVLHDIDLPGLLAAHAASGDAVTMALHDHARFNVVRTQGDRVCGFGSGSVGETMLAFTGIHVASLEAVEQIPASGFFHVIDLYEQLASARRVGLVRVDGCFWQDIGTPSDYLDLHGRLLSKATTPWMVNDRAIVDKDALLEEWGAIGAGAVIGQGARLARCVVWDNAIVEPGRQLTDCIVCPSQEMLG